MRKSKPARKRAAKTPVSKQTSESLKARCARLREEAEAGNDDASAMFFTSLFQAVSLRIPEPLKQANLILLLDRAGIE